MSLLHKLYFYMVHKILIIWKERWSESTFFDLILVELLDSDVPINLPSLILKQMQYVVTQDKNGHDGFWLSQIFKAYSISIQVWTMKSTKDVLGQVNHVALTSSMQCTGTSLYRLRIALDSKTIELTSAHQVFVQECGGLLSRISELEDILNKESVAHAESVNKLSLLILSIIPSP